MAKLILMRHGESIWNQRNLFTGWVDVPLSTKGIAEALAGGEMIKNLPIDIIFMSSLMRAQMTAMLAMSVHRSEKVPVIFHKGAGKLTEWASIHRANTEKEIIPTYIAWELNERMYGELQGLNKQETMEKFGEQQVKIWRRSYDVPPPHGESLKMTAARTIPYFEKEILPCLQKEKNVFVSAHGNSLRSIIMDIDNLSDEEVVSLELATGMPIIYEYNQGGFKKSNPTKE